MQFFVAAMAFSLKSTRSIGAQLGRVVSEELQGAVAAIGGRKSEGPESIHEARKHLKKIRSVLRLLRDDLGDDYGALDARFRSVARRLSPLRDADVVAETMKRLRRRYPKAISSSIFGVAKAALAARRRRAHGRLATDQLAELRYRLGESRETMPSRIRSIATARSMRGGVGRGYRRARKAMAEVDAFPTDAQFHSWRRRVKHHWYHMRLVEGLNAKVHSRVHQLHELESWLGDDHNLVVLRSVILKSPARFGGAKTVGLILGCIDSLQLTLRSRAMKRGSELFAPTPRLFRKQISRWWSG